MSRTQSLPASRVVSRTNSANFAARKAHLAFSACADNLGSFSQNLPQRLLAALHRSSHCKVSEFVCVRGGGISGFQTTTPYSAVGPFLPVAFTRLPLLAHHTSLYRARFAVGWSKEGRAGGIRSPITQDPRL